MSKVNDPIALIVGAEKKRGGVAESEAGWSGLGITSSLLALLLGVVCFAGPAMARIMGQSPTSRPMAVFWTFVVFGLGAGFGTGIGGLVRSRSGKGLPALGVVLNLALFAMVVYGVALGTPRSAPSTIRSIPPALAPR